MSEAVSTVKGYEQLDLFGEPAYEVVIRVGIVPHAEHVQYQVEARNVSTGDLLSMWSLPQRSVHYIGTDFAEADREAWRAIWELSGPF